MRMFFLAWYILLSIAAIGHSANESPVVVVSDTIYNANEVEIKPNFEGGIRAFYDFVGKNFRIPNVKNLNGKVEVEFIIEKDGSLSNFRVRRDVGHGTGKEAIRVISKSSKWIPGKQNGMPVRVRYIVPISFATH